jgi:predicted nucleic acid-binding protein
VTTWLVDTGPLVAYLDARDPAHDEVSACLNGFTGQLATSSAVVTEAMHFVAAAQAGPRLLADFLHATATVVYDLSTPPALDDVVTLMERYHDTPMDYADGTLVRLAEALDEYDVLTLDRRGFATYRAKRNRPLRMVLDLARSGGR